MPLEIGELFKSTCDMSFASKGLNSLFCSKVYTSLISTIICLILIMIIYPSKSKTKIWVFFKLGFYIFITNIIISFIHDGVIHNENSKKITKDNDEKILDGINKERGPVSEASTISPMIDTNPTSAEVFKTFGF